MALDGNVNEAAQNLALDITAEGVETKEVFDRLEGMGCDYLQGYHLSRPVPADACERDRRERTGLTRGAEIGALDGVDGDVEAHLVALADLLAVVEHRGVVLLALADDDLAQHVRLAEGEAHRLGGGAVGGLAVAAPGPQVGRHRGVAHRGHRERLEALRQFGHPGHSGTGRLLVDQGHAGILAVFVFAFKRNVRPFS